MGQEENLATAAAQGGAVALSLGCLVRMTLAVAAYSVSQLYAGCSRKGLSQSPLTLLILPSPPTQTGVGI